MKSNAKIILFTLLIAADIIRGYLIECMEYIFNPIVPFNSYLGEHYEPYRVVWNEYSWMATSVTFVFVYIFIAYLLFITCEKMEDYILFSFGFGWVFYAFCDTYQEYCGTNTVLEPNELQTLLVASIIGAIIAKWEWNKKELKKLKETS